MKQENARKKKTFGRKVGGWLLMIQSYSDPSAAFPRLPDLTAVKARWRIRCNQQDPLSLQDPPAGQLRPAGGNCGPIQGSAGFRASGLQLLSSSVSQSLQPGRPSAPDAILHLHNRAKGSLSFSSFYPILIVAPFRITECIT